MRYMFVFVMYVHIYTEKSNQVPKNTRPRKWSCPMKMYAVGVPHYFHIHRLLTVGYVCACVYMSENIDDNGKIFIYFTIPISQFAVALFIQRYTSTRSTKPHITFIHYSILYHKFSMSHISVFLHRDSFSSSRL